MPRLLLLLPIVLFAGCAREVPLSTAEAQAVDKLRRDPWVVMANIERYPDGSVVVTTKQGDERVLYRVRQDPAGEKNDMLLERLPIITFGKGTRTAFKKDDLKKPPQPTPRTIIRSDAKAAEPAAVQEASAQPAPAAPAPAAPQPAAPAVVAEPPADEAVQDDDLWAVPE